LPACSPSRRWPFRRSPLSAPLARSDARCGATGERWLVHLQATNLFDPARSARRSMTPCARLQSRLTEMIGEFRELFVPERDVSQA